MFRGFWKRWIRLLLLCIIGIIIIIVVSKPNGDNGSHHGFEFKWLDMNNVSKLKFCRNSRQGPNLITDEKGYVCRINEVLHNGCCSPYGYSIERYSCVTCQANRCCRIYENCISCCMQPDKRNILEKVLLHAKSARNPLLRLVRDTFELCLHKCRTSSVSLKQENLYRDNVYKHCFGLSAPRLQH